MPAILPAGIPLADAPLGLQNLSEAGLIALIFFLRTFNLTIATLRLLSVVRGRRIQAWILGFVQSFLFITTLAGVMSDIQSLGNVLAYAGGYATGLIAGISLEARLAPGLSLLRLTSAARGRPLLEAIHDAGYGATELSGSDQRGMLSVILCYTPRKHIGEIVALAEAVDPDVFITGEQVKEHDGGWMH